MKKILLTLCLLFFVRVSIQAQDVFFNNVLRQRLNQLLIDKHIAMPTNMLNYDPLIIRNLVSMENIEDNTEAEEDKYGIYDFQQENQILAYSLILLKNSSEYEVLDIINKGRSKIKRELKSYFRNHPEVPEELFPVYVDATNRVMREHSRLEKVWDVRIEKDKSDNSIYRYIDKASGGSLIMYEILN